MQSIYEDVKDKEADKDKMTLEIVSDFCILINTLYELP